MKEVFLATPGPVNVPDSILKEFTGLFHHRTEEFESLFTACASKTALMFDSDNPVLFFSCSGTGVMEAALTNTLSPNDKIICLEYGKFSSRFTEIAHAYQCHVIPISSPWGTTPDPEILKKTLRMHPDVKAVTACHCETSTGVIAPIEDYASIIANTDILFIADCISSVGTMPINQQKYHIDICLGTTNKGLICPPGCGIFSYHGEKFVDFMKKSTLPKFYFNIQKEISLQKSGKASWTPNINHINALNKSIDLMLEEGLEETFEYYKKIGNYIRERCGKLNLKLMAHPESGISDSVHVFFTSEATQIIEYMHKHNIIIAEGQEEFKGKIIRIGSFGKTTLDRIDIVINTLEKYFKEY
ncbi:MAG: pyridoxal-phosphate-dependent aminotransferase family protein [Brevinemataceae bacterium]